MQVVLSLPNIKRKTQLLMINSNEAKAGAPSPKGPQVSPRHVRGHTHTHTQNTP